MTVARIRTVTDGAIACSTMLWRYRGRLHLTTILKAEFSIEPGGTCAHRGVAAILDDDRTYGDNPARSVEYASDRVPYRARCDVLLRGHAQAPGGQPVNAASVRIGIARDGRPLLDHTIGVVGKRNASGAVAPFTRVALRWENALGGPGHVNPVGCAQPTLVDPADASRSAALGAVSPFWPERIRLLGGIDRRVLGDPIPALPDAMPWDYFQYAPRPLQIAPLQGGERLILDGVHPTLSRIDTQLPLARGAARLLERKEGATLANTTAVELRCDTLSIDVDRQTLELVWRGHHEVEESALDEMVVLAGLARPDAMLDFAALAALGMEPETPEENAPPPTIAKDRPADTTLVGPHDASSPAVAALPFAARSAVAAASPRAIATDATPWSPEPIAKAPAAKPGDSTLAERRRPAVPDTTLPMSPQEEAALKARPVAPFVLGAPKPAAPPTAPVPWKEAQSRTVEPHAEPAPSAESPLVSRLQSAGASTEEIEALLKALAPPK